MELLLDSCSSTINFSMVASFLRNVARNLWKEGVVPWFFSFYLWFFLCTKESALMRPRQCIISAIIISFFLFFSKFPQLSALNFSK